MNLKLEDIQKSLDTYLETKRGIFPRFYFLSNDDLLEILGNSKQPMLVQPHLKKCFDNIKSLDMAKVVRVMFTCFKYNSIALDINKIKFKKKRIERCPDNWSISALEGMYILVIEVVALNCISR